MLSPHVLPNVNSGVSVNTFKVQCLEMSTCTVARAYVSMNKMYTDKGPFSTLYEYFEK
jgi:hypothetical protein